MMQVHHVMCHMFIQIINEVYLFNSRFVFHQTWNIQSFWEVYPILCNLSLGITVYASTLIIPTRLSRIPHPVETFQTTLAGHTGWQKINPLWWKKKLDTWYTFDSKCRIYNSLVAKNVSSPTKKKHFFWGGSAEGVLEVSTQPPLQTAVSVFCNRSVVGGVP